MQTTQSPKAGEQGLNLAKARVTGFFSMPSKWLCEANPSAYNAAMAVLPAGAGTCANCGTGILHHVMVQMEGGATYFIGTDCAEKVGGEIARCTRNKFTSAQLAKREEEFAIRRQKWQQDQQDALERKAARSLEFSDAISALLGMGTQFHDSLCEQLLCGQLSEKQAHYVCKAIFGRQTKRNSEAWSDMEVRLI